MLEVRNVSKRYGDDTRGYLALDGINLEIRDGEFLCLLGASGCGKSTLLNILAGFERATAGNVALDGRAIEGAGQDRVMCFQDAGSALFPWLTVAENIAFGLRTRGMSRERQQPVVSQYLNMVRLVPHAAKFPAQLSGGMRQRLQIARALAIEPAILLMDEPFAALDALTRRQMHRILLKLWQETGRTIVFVTHDISEALAMADRVAVMSKGPASRIRQVLSVDMPRPRTQSMPSYAALFNSIESLIGDEAGNA